MASRERPLTDDELMRLIEKHVEDGDPSLRSGGRGLRPGPEMDDDVREVEGPTEVEDAEACPHCGAPALAFAECDACGEEGCLPRDDWTPGADDPCLTRCARCGRAVHVDCAGVDEAGNRVCCGPRMASAEDW